MEIFGKGNRHGSEGNYFDTSNLELRPKQFLHNKEISKHNNSRWLFKRPKVNLVNKK